ncbi:hypothetical protein [Nocardia arthritidis]|uniref:Adenylyl-sulfate kinase n=1 Tax=Nocardia arthritidis TaxID=228602 RepID=A0A6G9YQL8_9NOCA|nr:hypothetical protein [Nocardia arthritidis]QIS15514.1 hypothetical protein F5544_38460 [Nocardia arthritidis]
MTEPSRALLIGGRSGVGKSSVGIEIHVQLSAAGVRHCLIEGDNLDLAYPDPGKYGLAERNLAAMWANYRELGYRRLIYTNTASVFADVTDQLAAAMGDRPEITAILLTCSDETARKRLAQREIGTAFEEHVERGAAMARRLDTAAPERAHRVVTDGRTVAEIAADVITLSGWLP